MQVASRTHSQPGDRRALFRQRLESGQARLHPTTFPQRELWETSPVTVADPANHICGFVEIKGRITFDPCFTGFLQVSEKCTIDLAVIFFNKDMA